MTPTYSDDGTRQVPDPTGPLTDSEEIDEHPREDAVRVIATALARLECGQPVDPYDPEDCGSVASEAVWALIRAGILPVDRQPPTDLRVAIPAPLADEIAADLAAGGDRAERWRPHDGQVPNANIAGRALLLEGDHAGIEGRVVGWFSEDEEPVAVGVAPGPDGVTGLEATRFEISRAWAPVGGVDGGPRPDIDDRVLVLEFPDGGIGHVGTVGMVDNITGRVGVDLDDGGSALATKWAVLPPEIPAEVHALRDDLDQALDTAAGIARITGQPTPGEASTPDSAHDDVAAILHRLENPAPDAPVDPLTVDPDQAWPCADWCCSKGCPGIGNALCGRPPCDGRMCTCGNADIRAVAHDRQRLARTLRDLVRWLTAERDRAHDRRFDAYSNVLDHLRGQGLDVDYLGQPVATGQEVQGG